MPKGKRSMQSYSISWLTVGQVGMIRLDIPVYTIGDGKPVLGITCFIHGNESAGVYIVARMLDHLQFRGITRGTVHIIPVANPAAQFVGERVSLLDYMDLNRVGSGSRDGSFTERLSAQLFDFLSMCDLVINIHEFEMRTPTTGVFMNAGSTEIKVRTLAAIQAFSPDIIWVIDPSQRTDARYQATLDTALAEAGVVNFPVETTQLAFLTDTEINRAAKGLLRVAAYMGMLKPELESSFAPAPAFTREEFRSETAGLWEPSRLLMQEIKPGEAIGILRTLPEFKSQTIYSPRLGILMQCRNRQLVATGASLFSIGHGVDEIIAL
jgi:predicted deacylase